MTKCHYQEVKDFYTREGISTSQFFEGYSTEMGRDNMLESFAVDGIAKIKDLKIKLELAESSEKYHIENCKGLEAKLAEAESRIKNLQVNIIAPSTVTLGLQNKLKVAIEALKYYSDDGGRDIEDVSTVMHSSMGFEVPVDKGGKRAREALRKIGECV